MGPPEGTPDKSANANWARPNHQQLSAKSVQSSQLCALVHVVALFCTVPCATLRDYGPFCT
eukprot:1004704-Alexandrium_andersonii.AAC.1